MRRFLVLVVVYLFLIYIAGAVIGMLGLVPNNIEAVLIAIVLFQLAKKLTRNVLEVM